MTLPDLSFLKPELDRLYEAYNRPQWIHPDPLQYLYAYPDPLDREIVGLIASSLAYGRVAQILKSVSAILDEMGPSPRRYLERTSFRTLLNTFRGFRHRFTSGQELSLLLKGVQRVLQDYGSLQHCFMAAHDPTEGTVLTGLCFLTGKLTAFFPHAANSLIACPQKSSACKRLHLFLRWMVRQDRVDPGGWDMVSPSILVIPLDTHMHRLARCLNLTQRQAADGKTAMEVTHAFQTIDRQDPVRYDFCLTRPGIRGEKGLERLMELARGVESKMIV